ncbi:MAG: hypothetical protein ACRCYQ_16890 [Nocardioides sp.]
MTGADGPAGRAVVRWGWRLPGPLWLVGLVVAPVIFAAGATVTDRGRMERELVRAGLAALEREDLDRLHLIFEARDATVEVPAGVEVTSADLARAKAVLEAIDGVRVVEVPRATADSRPTEAQRS